MSDEIEVTPGMIEAGRKKWRSYLGGLGSKVEDDVWADVFRAMYAARPKPPRIFRAAIEAENEAVELRGKERELEDALNEALLAIDTYYNGPDREWAQNWLLKAYATNKEKDANQ